MLDILKKKYVLQNINSVCIFNQPEFQTMFAFKLLLCVIPSALIKSKCVKVIALDAQPVY